MKENECMCGDCCEDPCVCEKIKGSAVALSEGLEGPADRWHYERDAFKEKITNAIFSLRPTNEKIDVTREILEELDMMDYREAD